MAELLVRAGAPDAALVEKLLTGPSAGRPSRIVVDAHVASGNGRMQAAAAMGGVPFIIDPQTYFFQDYQHPSCSWVNLSFAEAAAQSPADLLRPGAANKLVEAAIDYQVEHGATMIVAPYVNIDSSTQGWIEVQIALWRATRDYMDRQALKLPLIAVLALGWRLLGRATWPGGLAVLARGLTDLDPDEVALAASQVDAGAHPEERLSSLATVIEAISPRYPVIAWQQGTLGESAVAAGAIGYECGIGWRERCNLRQAMSQFRKPRSHGGMPRPVYIEALRRSLPKRTLEAFADRPALVASIVCSNPLCCPNGILDLLEDARPHAIQSRLRTLDAVASPAQSAWRWQYLAEASREGLALAARLNAAAGRLTGVSRIDASALRATLEVADHRRTIHRRRNAA